MKKKRAQTQDPQTQQSTLDTAQDLLYWETDLCLQRAAGSQKQLNAAGRAVCQSESHELLPSGQVLVTFWLSQLAADIPAFWVTWKMGKKKQTDFHKQKNIFNLTWKM